MKKRLYYTVSLLFIIVLSACGGAGTDGRATTPGRSISAVIKSSALAISQNVAGIQLAITVPPGVSPPLSANGAVNTAATVEITSSAPAGQTLPGATFTPATATSAGQLIVSGIVAAGFKPGDQITIHLSITEGYYPVESDFRLSSFEAFDTNGAIIPGLSPTLTTTIL